MDPQVQRSPASPPPYFYRVQHDQSFTIYKKHGFESNAHYVMGYRHWINKNKIHKHLYWKDRSVEPSPFISVFDNEDDALARVRVHQLSQNRPEGILIAQINAQSLSPTVLSIEGVQRDIIHLPAWKDHGGTIFLSTMDVRRYLGVQVSISQASEWFALDEIPREMIVRTERFN